MQRHLTNRDGSTPDTPTDSHPTIAEHRSSELAAERRRRSWPRRPRARTTTFRPAHRLQVWP